MDQSGSARKIMDYTRYDETLKNLKHFSHEPGHAKAIGSNRVNYIIEDKTGLLWVSHENEFSLFDPVTEFFYRYEGELHDITMSFTDKKLPRYGGLQIPARLWFRIPIKIILSNMDRTTKTA